MSEDPLQLFLFWCLCQNFYKSLKILKSGCLRGSSLSEASEGEFPLQNWKKLQFSNSIRCIPFVNILLKTIIHFQSNIGNFHVYSSHLSCFYAFVRHYKFLAIEKIGVSEGELPPEAGKMQFLNSICKIWCISFANILLKIQYSLPMKYWL